MEANPMNIKSLDRQKDKKIKFLQEQNQNLREQITNLEKNLKLNKESLDLLVKKISLPKNTDNQKSLNNINQEYIETNDSSHQIANLQKIIDNLLQENQRHLENIRKLINDRNNAQARVKLSFFLY